MTKVIVVATSGRGHTHIKAGNPPTYVVHEREISDDFTDEATRWKIGATIAAAVEHAWKGGYDPTTIWFKVRFE